MWKVRRRMDSTLLISVLPWLLIFAGAGVALVCICIAWLRDHLRTRTSRAATKEQVQPETVLMPGMGTRAPSCGFDEHLAATFLDEVALMPTAVEPELPYNAEELKRQIDWILYLVEEEKRDE